jgi:hypothetical protein
MDDLPDHESRIDRIARAAARVNAATARVSQVKAVLTTALERLALAGLVLQESRSQDPRESPPDGDPMDAADTP